MLSKMIIRTYPSQIRSQEVGDTEEQDVEVVEMESDGSFGFIKKLLNFNFSDI